MSPYIFCNIYGCLTAFRMSADENFIFILIHVINEYFMQYLFKNVYIQIEILKNEIYLRDPGGNLDGPDVFLVHLIPIRGFSLFGVNRVGKKHFILFV